jgi:PhnB protein
MSWLSPYLVVKDPDAALAFYQRAFGFEKKMAIPGPDGRTKHAEVTWRDCVFMFGAEGDYEGLSYRAPATSGNSCPISLYVYCDDVDALFRRATAAGATGAQPPRDEFYGDRVCRLIDPDGYSWFFATNVADFDPTKAPH